MNCVICILIGVGFLEKKEMNQVGIPVLVTEDATLIFDEAALIDYYKEK